jgi:hypothetical protein
MKKYRLKTKKIRKRNRDQILTGPKLKKKRKGTSVNAQ